MNDELEDIVLDKILDGDQTSCRFIIDQYKSMVFNLAFKIVKNREEAEEIAQDSFLKAFKHLGSFNRKSKFSTWLYRITYNHALSKLRLKKIPRSSIDGMGDYELPATQDFENAFGKLKAKQQGSIVKQAINALDEEDGMLISLYYINELPMEEIAQVTGLTKENVKVKVHRARKKMYLYLSKMLKDELKELL